MCSRALFRGLTLVLVTCLSGVGMPAGAGEIDVEVSIEVPLLILLNTPAVRHEIEQAAAALPEVSRLMVKAMRVWIPDVKIKAPGKILIERWGK